MTAVGLLVGGIAGGLAAPLVDGTSPTATALIRIDQPIDANQIVTNSVPSPETQQAYLAGEIVYLSSSGFADAVGNELKLPTPPSLLAAQQGQSALVRITATEPTTDEARAALDVALKVYAGRVQQLASDRTGAAIDAITAVIVRVRAETAADAERNDEAVNQLALDDKLRTLEQQRLSLQSQLLRAPGIQVVEPITAESAQSDPSLPIVGGTMLGGLLALAGSLAWRRRTGVIASASQLDRQVTPVLLPVVRLGKRAGTYARSELSRARTLYGQLPAPRTGEILVVGASAHSGTDIVAKLLYMGAVEHVSVSAVNVVGEFANLSSAAVRAKLDALPADDGQTVIIDGGSVATAPQMLAVAERAGQIVVVVRIGRDVAADVEVLLHAIRNEDVPVTAICTKGRLATSDGLLTGRRGRSEGGRHSLGSKAPVKQALPAAPLPTAYEPPLAPPVPQPGQQLWGAEQFDGAAIPAEPMVGQVGTQPEIDATAQHDGPSYTMSEVLLDQIPTPTEGDNTGDAPFAAGPQEAPVDESNEVPHQGEQHEPHAEHHEVPTDTTPEEIYAPIPDDEHPTEQLDPLSAAWHVPDENDAVATQDQEQKSDAEQQVFSDGDDGSPVGEHSPPPAQDEEHQANLAQYDDPHSDNGHHPPAADDTDLAVHDEQSELHVEQFEHADNGSGIPAEDEQSEHPDEDEHLVHPEGTDGDPPGGFADAVEESPSDQGHPQAPADEHQPEQREANSATNSERSGGDNLHPRPWFSGLQRRPDQVEQRSAPSFVVPAPPVEVSHTPVQDDQQHSDQPEASSESEPESPAEETNQRRPWVSLLRRKPAQGEQDTSGNGQQPPPDDIDGAPAEHQQDHTHAQN